MTNTLGTVYSSLHPEARAVYDAIFEPVVVGTPPTFAARNLCVTADGEIRHYGWRNVGGRRLRVYIASRDLGLNWELCFAAPDEIGAFMQSPFSGEWIALFSSEKDGRALCAARSKTGPGDPTPDILTLPWKGLELRQLLPLTHRRRWVAAFSVVDIHSPDCYHAAVLLSDDDGQTWRRVDIPPVADVPRVFPGDLRPHWFNNGCEPTVAELADGSLLLAVRTSGPHAAFYRSTDGGETWGTPKTRDCFWQSNTMPYLFRLSDGRLLFIWNNTASLPTRDAAEYPELGKDELNGVWETVFTNRDALHAAISCDDGRTWRGFREIALTEPRNAADFRDLGHGPFDEYDKSVHQTQALELPGGKVLLSYGQNPAARRLAIFDPDWLLETSRQEDFRHGLANISHHLYVDSLSGGYRGWAGHCAWNRVPGAVMSREPDAPEGAWRRESVLLARIRDPRLVSDVAGAVWNFPAIRRGQIEIECRVAGAGFRLSLLDHWINPCDVFNATRAPFSIFLNPSVTGANWCRVEIIWDCDAATARLLVDDRDILIRDLAEIPEAGFSYLHLQTSDECEDANGTYFHSLQAGGAAAPTRKIKVACIGDSITYGYLLDHPERDAFPAQLQRLLGDGYDVRNFGVPALGVYLHLPWHTANGRRAWSLSPECAQALAWEPDIVISNLGANDLEEYPREALSSPNGAPVLPRGTFRTQYANVLKAFKADGRKPRILMWTRLCAMKAENVAKYGASLTAIADELRAVAAEVGAEGFDAYAVTATSAQTEAWPDATHPPASVHRALAEALLAALRQGNGGVSVRTEDWPLIVIRHTTGVNNLPDIFGQLADCHRRHPGACDEFWFATGSRKTIPALEKECETFARYRPVCDEIGVIPSYQQGLTLGHGVAHDGPPKPDSQAFPEDAWQVGRDGQRLGFLCPRSPFVLDYEFNYAKTVLRIAAPGSYWIDDDLRLGVHKPEGCFCDRCIAAFNAKTGGNWTREALVERLFSDAPREPLRAAWIDFNAESLAVYAAKVRDAADALRSPCRLAYQAVWADTIYTASSYRPLLEALSGSAHKPVGIRPGAGFYTEAEPRGMVSKCLSVAREAERCRNSMPRSGNLSGEAALNGPQGRLNAAEGRIVASICYEQETYPRHVLHKSPDAIMTESALALASGCDSLSLYWYAGEAPEPIEEYDRFLKTLKRARPYFERLAASTRRTRLGGVARFVGSAAAETPDFDLRDQKDFDLACAGIPVTVAESGTKVWYLTDKSRREMTEADEAVLDSGAVVDVGDVGKYPLASRRTKLLDDLDAATGGTFPIRVDACRPLRILPRVRDDGRLDSVTLLNLSIGGTDKLKIRVRRPVSPKVFLQSAKMAKPIPLPCVPGALPDEFVITLDELQGWQIVSVFFV